MLRNAGTRWTRDEEIELTQNWLKNELEQLSINHGRTVLALTARLKKLGYIPEFLDEIQIKELHHRLRNPDIAVLNFLKERNIKSIFHFSHIDNLDNIAKFGFWSRKFLEENKIKHIVTDYERRDNDVNSISMSLSLPNIFMLSKKNKSPELLNKLILFEVDSSILASCKFNSYPTNAANHELQRYVKTKVRNFNGEESLTYLFLNSKLRQKFKLPKFVPTDQQSEVMLKDFFPAFFIKSIHVHGEHTNYFLDKINHIKNHFFTFEKIQIVENSKWFTDIWNDPYKRESDLNFKERKWSINWEKE